MEKGAFPVKNGEKGHGPAQPVRMIALDLDGTVLDSEKRITPRTRAALEKAIEAGAAVLPATGRLRNGLPQEFLDIPGVRYAVTANGAAVLDLAEGRRIWSGCLSQQDALRLHEMCRGWDVLFDVYAGDAIFTEATRFARLAEFAPPAMLDYFCKTRTPVDDLAAFLPTLETPIEKVTALFTNPDERRAAFAVLADGGRYLVTSSIPRNVEVNAAGVDKGVGLLALADFLGVPHGAVMACGDSSNDAAMLRAAGFSVAMGNASDEIKALADFVTDTNDADGVAKAVERWVLGAPQV